METKSYENSIIVKFLIYEAIITFTDLFYIAFVTFDIEGLKQQMASLFLIDIFRRFAAETLIHYLRNRSSESSLEKVKEDSELLLKQTELEINKPNYEAFDDYLEIVTNFGYLVMLSSAFPSAPLWIMVSHFFEVLHDKYKVMFLYKRQLPTKFHGTGQWKDVLYTICCISILTVTIFRLRTSFSSPSVPTR